MVVEPGTRIKIAFTATYPDGELFDTSSQEVAAEYDVDADKRFRPIVLEVGVEPTISSLQEGLLGMEVGETKRIEVPHEDLQITYDRSEFETMVGEPAEPGQEIHAKTGLLGEVVDVDDETVTVDFDPERSDETLTFAVEVLEIE
jgi:FKBP-type peptidyl-prolyl cis-trans isomerase 2